MRSLKTENTSATVVMFRKYRNGEIVALFPMAPSDHTGSYMTCYMHTGQHGSAGLCTLAATSPATERDYAPLLRELREVGYDDLRIVQRTPSNAYQVRRSKALAAMD